MAIRPSIDQIEAAARVLDRLGRVYGWWPESTPAYDQLDAISKDELQSIVEGMLIAATNVAPLEE